MAINVLVLYHLTNYCERYVLSGSVDVFSDWLSCSDVSVL